MTADVSSSLDVYYYPMITRSMPVWNRYNRSSENADPTKPENDFTKQVAVLDRYGERNGFMLIVIGCGFG